MERKINRVNGRRQEKMERSIAIWCIAFTGLWSELLYSIVYIKSIERTETELIFTYMWDSVGEKMMNVAQ